VTHSHLCSRHHYIWVAAILLVGATLRLGYLQYAMQMPDYTWADPDGYIEQARRLTSDGGWRWTFDAVTYRINQRRHALPPGFSVFLSLFLLFPGFPLSAQLAFIGLGLFSIAVLFDLGRLLHSSRAGLIAAAASALAVHNIIGVWSTSQEGLYLPVMLVAFNLLARAMIADAAPWRFAAVGVTFGLATLVRSMPLFFAVPAALAIAWLARDRRQGVFCGAAFLAGFLLPTAPYSIALSHYFGEVTIIDTHGSIHQAVAPGASAPSIGETASALWDTVSASPGTFIVQCLERARSLLHINGGRILQIYVVADSYASAVAWKAAVHLATDGLLLCAATLAPLGAALSHRPRVAVPWLLWTAVNVGIASVGGFSGARLRAPFEPFLVVLAAVVFAGGWRVAPKWIAAALPFTAVMAVAVLPQVPRSVAGWPDYGVKWPSIWIRDYGRLSESAGINVPAFNAVAEFSVTWAPRDERPIAVQIRGAGVTLDSHTFGAGETHRFKVWWPPRALAFLRIESAEPPQGELRIAVPR
jgi:4-amino-4-deoxy-L-arabinose transferase-like glycosyltransferase